MRPCGGEAARAAATRATGRTFISNQSGARRRPGSAGAHMSRYKMQGGWKEIKNRDEEKEARYANEAGLREIGDVQKTSRGRNAAGWRRVRDATHPSAIRSAKMSDYLSFAWR